VFRERRILVDIKDNLKCDIYIYIYMKIFVDMLAIQFLHFLSLYYTSNVNNMIFYNDDKYNCRNVVSNKFFFSNDLCNIKQ